MDSLHRIVVILMLPSLTASKDQLKPSFPQGAWSPRFFKRFSVLSSRERKPNTITPGAFASRRLAARRSWDVSGSLRHEGCGREGVSRKYQQFDQEIATGMGMPRVRLNLGCWIGKGVLRRSLTSGEKYSEAMGRRFNLGTSATTLARSSTWPISPLRLHATASRQCKKRHLSWNLKFRFGRDGLPQTCLCGPKGEPYHSKGSAASLEEGCR
jgi:hypothetical protein